jgi:hypothetical protein
MQYMHVCSISSIWMANEYTEFNPIHSTCIQYSVYRSVHHPHDETQSHLQWLGCSTVVIEKPHLSGNLRAMSPHHQVVCNLTWFIQENCNWINHLPLYLMKIFCKLAADEWLHIKSQHHQTQSQCRNAFLIGLRPKRHPWMRYFGEKLCLLKLYHFGLLTLGDLIWTYWFPDLSVRVMLACLCIMFGATNLITL